MSVIKSGINTRSADFQSNAAAMRGLVGDLRAKAAEVSLGGGEAARAKHTARGKLLPRDRVGHLLDRDAFLHQRQQPVGGDLQAAADQNIAPVAIRLRRVASMTCWWQAPQANSLTR